MKVRARGGAQRCAYCHDGPASGILVPCSDCGIATHEDCDCPSGCSVPWIRRATPVPVELSEPPVQLDERADTAMGLLVALAIFLALVAVL